MIGYHWAYLLVFVCVISHKWSVCTYELKMISISFICLQLYSYTQVRAIQMYPTFNQFNFKKALFFSCYLWMKAKFESIETFAKKKNHSWSILTLIIFLQIKIVQCWYLPFSFPNRHISYRILERRCLVTWLRARTCSAKESLEILSGS